jgi:predicted amidohydrolase YtcJ
LIVIDRDIYSIAPCEIGGTEVLLTLLGGEEVHRAESFDA